MDNLNKTLNVTNDNYLNIIVYEEEVYKKLFPSSNNEDYIKTQFAVDYPFEAINYAEEKCNITLNGSRFVVIDEKFIFWCKKNNKETNINSINEYSNIISDEDSKRLWIKSTRHYDLVTCSIPLIIKYYYEQTKYLRYHNFSSETLIKAKKLLSNTFNINSDEILIYENALIKDDALINKGILETYFRNIIESETFSPNLVKSIFKGYEEDCFTIKYLICGIKINREYKMTKESALKDFKIDLGKILVNDEMANLSDILSEENPNYMIYPAFDRIINIREIESSDEVLRKFLPQLA